MESNREIAKDSHPFFTLSICEKHYIAISKLVMPTCELRPEKDRQWNTKLHWAVWWFDIYILGVSPSVAAVPHDDRGVFRNISSPPSLSAILRAEMVSLKCSLHAKVAHSRHRVLPVPVGLSRTPFTFWNKQADVQWFQLLRELLPTMMRFCLLAAVNYWQKSNKMFHKFLLEAEWDYPNEPH